MRVCAVAVLVAMVGAARAQDAPEPSGAPADRQPGYLGVSVLPLNDETRPQFDIAAEVTQGVILAAVTEGSAAHKAGFKPGDVVVTFDGNEVRSVEQLVGAVTARKAGDMVAYTVRRGSGTIHGKLTLGERPAMVETPAEPMPPKPERSLEERMERAQRQMEEMRRRILEERRAAPVPPDRRPGLEAWIDREERGLAQARERDDAEKIRWHLARLSILREMREAGTAAPAGDRRGDAQQRLNRIERKLDAILEMLRERE